MATPIRLLKTFNDNNGDGIVELITTTVYGSDGRLLSESLDFGTNGRGADGSADSVTTYTYDANGNRTGQFLDRNLDGRFEYVLNSSFVFDDEGNLTITYTDGDINAFQNTYVYEFDADGNFLKETIDGRVTQEYTYDDVGNLVLFQDKVQNTAIVYEYDASNRIISTARYDDDSGVPGYTETYEYDASGNFVGQEKIFSATGRRNIETFTYDSAGNLVESYSETNVDDVDVGGDFPQFSRFSRRRVYEYDEAGNAIRETLTQRNLKGGSGDLDFVYTYEYDEAGNFIKGTFAPSLTSEPVTINYYDYDEAGRLTYEAFDNGGEGNLDRITTYEFSDVVPTLVATNDSIAGESDILVVDNVFTDNGSGVDSSPTGSRLQVSQVNGVANSADAQVTLASGALVKIAADGQLVYNPNGQFDTLAPGSTATDSFTYTATDGTGLTDTATVNVTITGAANPSVSESVLRQRLYDRDGNGVPEEVETYTYDAAGSLVQQAFDSNGDGSPETVQTFDAAGNLLSRVDRNPAGVVIQAETYEYDDTGNLIRQSFDGDGDGVDNFVQTYTYDENNNLTSRSTDRDGDGSIESITTTTYTYDENNNILSKVSDFSDDGGTTDYSLNFTYDESGNVTSESIDYQGDGEIDFVTTTTYDAAGNVIQEISGPTNGLQTRVVNNTYDEQGNLLQTVTDSDNDGEIDRIRTFSYDAAGNQIRSTSDFNADGVADTTFVSTYDEAGNLLSSASDFNGTGVLQDFFLYTYDAAGNRTSFSVDYEGDGTLENITTYTFDAAGNEVAEFADFGADGSIDSTTTSLYVVPGGAIASQSLIQDDLLNGGTTQSSNEAFSDITFTDLSIGTSTSGFSNSSFENTTLSAGLAAPELQIAPVDQFAII